MNESLLKKEFKQSDVQRVRNLVNKDFTAKTKSQTGYQKVYKKYNEGDVWEESGKYGAYEKRLMQGNIKAFAIDIEQWVEDFVSAESSFVTEDGDVEDWKSNDTTKKRVMQNLKTYLGHLKEHI